MGSFASTHRGRRKSTEQPREQPKEQPVTVPAASAVEDVKMDEAADTSERKDVIGETQLGSLRVKDPDAWKGDYPRPRSALKHQQGAEGGEATSPGGGAGGPPSLEPSPSGRRTTRRVSFQVNGLGPLPGLELPDTGDEHHPAHKRAKGSEEFSMRYLVDKFYSRVLTVEQLRPFFDGVDMLKLKNQQEALMLLVFGGQELLEDELPGLAADLRLIHLHLLFEGLNLSHWQMFADAFSDTLDELPQIPDDVKQRAKLYMATTKNHFRPIEPHEWPPKVVYKGWTKRSCPFTSAASSSKPSGQPHACATGTSDANNSNGEDARKDHSDFVLPGINSPSLESMGISVGTAKNGALSGGGAAGGGGGGGGHGGATHAGWSTPEQTPPPEEEDSAEVTPVEEL